MSKNVLDASAIIALLEEEPGAEKLTDDVLANSVASAVNIAEVQAWYVRDGADPAEIWKRIVFVIPEIIPFTDTHARVTGDLIAKTRKAGLSLGDRACIALASIVKGTAYTADRPWLSLKLGVRIKSIR